MACGWQVDSLPLTTRENPYFLINISNWLEFSHPVAGKSNLEHISYSCNEKTLSYWLLLLLLLSRFSHVWLCATPWAAVYQAPPCIGFSRQEYWSGLPFPSPILLTAAAAAAKLLQSCPTVRIHIQQPTRLPRPWDSPGKNTGVGCHFLLQCIKVKREKWKWSHSVMSDS